jgi:predicted RNase H-like HicB family nuclease/DNA-binding CsgD family transcriptional regulator
MTTYTAVAERSGGWWAIRVRELPGVFTQAKRLDQVEPTVRDAVSVFLDVDPASFGVEVTEILPDVVVDEVRQAREARTRAAVAQGAADAAMRTAVYRLIGSGLTVRDIGRVLGISPQRVSQLAPTARVRPGASKREQAG